jgi:hypothetical protein
MLFERVKNNSAMVNTFDNDRKVVLTLDAGGTNFVFSAIQGNREILEPIHKKAHPDDLEKCLSMVIDGFKEVAQKITLKASAISFAFPGPADYEKGIIQLLKEEFRLDLCLKKNSGSLFLSIMTGVFLLMVKPLPDICQR